VGHSWGQNVIDMGLMNLGMSLAAPMLLFPGFILTNRVIGATDVWVVGLPTGPDQPYVLPIGPVSHPVGAHFPYGHLVPPDVPL
jgi:hypothetical protein